MRVVLDGSALGRRKTGNETYIRGLIRGFEQLGDTVDLAVLTTPRCPSPRSSAVRWVEIPEGTFLTRNYRTIPRVLARSDAQLYHAIYWARTRGPMPYVVMIHDLSFVAYPVGFKPHERLVFTMLVRRVAEKARRILTVSEYSKREIVERWQIPPERITVTYNGVDPLFTPGEEPPPDDVILYVGNLHPRKNLLRLLDAFVLLKKRGVRARLVIVGQKTWGSDAIFAAVRRHGIIADIDFTGFVEHQDLVDLYRRATVTVLPSLYEGFGLPALEAMACGSPVVASNTTALPEVVGDAGILVDPRSAEAIAEGLASVLGSPNHRATLHERGVRQARTFTWQRTARATLEAYRAALDLD